MSIRHEVANQQIIDPDEITPRRVHAEQNARLKLAEDVFAFCLRIRQAVGFDADSILRVRRRDVQAQLVAGARHGSPQIDLNARGIQLRPFGESRRRDENARADFPQVVELRRVRIFLRPKNLRRARRISRAGSRRREAGAQQKRKQSGSFFTPIPTARFQTIPARRRKCHAR